MSDEAVRVAIATKINSEFVPLHPTVKVMYENTKFTQPSNQVPFIHVAIHEGHTCRTELGTLPRKFQTEGVVDIQVLVPEDTGTATQKRICNSLKKILLDVQLPLTDPTGSVTFYGCDYAVKGGSGGWHVVHVLFDYRARYSFDRSA